MNKTITVTGTGRLSAEPDYVRLSMSLAARDKQYEQAMALAAKQIAQLTGSLTAVGFEKKAIKTISFQVDTEYDSIPEQHGNYTQVFKGFVVRHDLELAFDFDQQRLSRALTAITEGLSEPELSVVFTIKEPTEVKEALLKAAANNAHRQAQVLCAAAGVSLGDLLTINYSWGEISLISDTDFRLMERAPAMMAKTIDFEPADIELTDSATFVWAIH